jgi:hypothetical protein
MRNPWKILLPRLDVKAAEPFASGHPALARHELLTPSAGERESTVHTRWNRRSCPAQIERACEPSVVDYSRIVVLDSVLSFDDCFFAMNLPDFQTTAPRSTMLLDTQQDPGQLTDFMGSLARSTICQRRLGFWLCSWFLFLGVPVYGIDRGRTLEELDRASWTYINGAPGAVNALVQTTDGYLWLVTATGGMRQMTSADSPIVFIVCDDSRAYPAMQRLKTASLHAKLFTAQRRFCHKN